MSVGQNETRASSKVGTQYTLITQGELRSFLALQGICFYFLPDLFYSKLPEMGYRLQVVSGRMLLCRLCIAVDDQPKEITQTCATKDLPHKGFVRNSAAFSRLLGFEKYGQP